MLASAVPAETALIHNRAPAQRLLRVGGLLALVAVLLTLRNPAVVGSPRFWAEEADLLFANAWFLPGADALWLNTTWRSGYLNVVPLVSTWLAAKLAAVEAAPTFVLVTIAIVQGAVLALALAGPRRDLARPLQRALAVSVLLYFPYHHGLLETWLSVMNASVHLGIGALLVLLADEARETHAWRWLSRTLLALGAVTGPYTFVLAPLFLLKWRWTKDREAGRRAALVVGLAAVQGALAATVLLGGDVVDSRDLSTFTAARPYVALVYQGLYAVVGEIPGRMLLAGLGALPDSPALGWGHVTVGGAIAALVMASAWLVAARSPARTLLLFAAGLWFAFTVAFAVKGLAGFRYAVCPSVALGMLLVHAAFGEDSRVRPVRALLGTLAAAGIASGVVESALVPGPMTGVGQADWRTEVGRWRADPDHPLRVWPSSVWFTNLADPDRRDALARALAQTQPRIRADASGAVMPLPAAGLPAYFSIQFDACVERPASLVVTGLASAGEALFERRFALPAGCTALDLNSMALAFEGFARYSRVTALGFASPDAGLPGATVSAFRLTTPTLTVDHPLSGD